MKKKYEDQEWLTAEEAADYLRIPVKQVRTLSSDLKIPRYKLGALNRYKTDELRELLNQNKIPIGGNKYGNKTRSKDRVMDCKLQQKT